MAPHLPLYRSPRRASSTHPPNNIITNPQVTIGRAPRAPFFENPARVSSIHSSNSAPNKSKRSKNPKPKRPLQAQQLQLTDEQWQAEVDKFHAAVEDEEATPTLICIAWKGLRQAFGNKYEAIITLNSPLDALDPFPFWASENLEVSVLKKVLEAEFHVELAKFERLTLLKRIAEEAGLIIWHILLFFGPSTFSETRLGMLRKRARIFHISREHGSWLFTQSYKFALRQFLVNSSKDAEINTSTIPESGPLIIFKTSQMSELAVANPEFETEGAKKTINSQPMGTKISLLTGIPRGCVVDQSIEGTETHSSSQGLDSQGQSHAGQKNLIGAQSKTHVQMAACPTLQKEPIYAGAQAQDREKGKGLPPLSQTGLMRTKVTSTAVHHRTTLRRTTPLKTAKDKGRAIARSPRICFGGAQDKDFALPSNEQSEYIREGKVTRDGTTSSNANLYPGSFGGSQANGQVTATRETATMVDLPSTEDLSKEPNITSHDFSSRSVLTASQQRPFKEESVVGSPTLYTRNTSLISSKRSIKEESEPEDGRGKRRDTTDTKARLLEPREEWDDETIIDTLKLLEAIRPDDFIVADGMKTYVDAPLPRKLCADYEKNGGIVMLPLKMDDGHRLLTVIQLRPIDPTGFENEGVIQYFDPRGGLDNDGGPHHYKPRGSVATFIGHAFPLRDPDPDAWITQTFVCPDLLEAGDNGVAVCLAAICIVGDQDFPLSPQLPEEANWMFWRHTILGSFVTKDKGKGQAWGCTPRERSTSDTQAMTQTMRSPVDCLKHRAANARMLLEMVSSGVRMIFSLQARIDQSYAAFRVEKDFRTLESSTKTLSRDAELEQATSYHLLKTRLQNLDMVHHRVNRSLEWLSEWREGILEAIGKELDETVGSLGGR